MNEILINDDLLEEVRTSRNTSKWNNGNHNRIVDFGYTHEYLLMNRPVDEIIKEYYLKSIKEIYTPEEWKRLTNPDTKNKNNLLNYCSFLIEGALHNRENLWIKIGTLLELKDQHNFNIKYKYFSDLNPYFISYASSFKSGYNQFLNVKVKPHLLFENSKEEAAQIIFKFLTNNQSNPPVVTVGNGFKTKFENNNYDIDYDLLDGLTEGYLYRAWSIIFSQNELFQPLFRKFSNGEKITSTKKTELKKEDLLKLQCKLIPRINLQYVYDYFSILTKPNDKDEIFLSEQKLLIFIESTFVNQDPKQQSFDKPFKKKYIRTIFKKFEDNCSGLEYDQKKSKEKYYKILNKGFVGFSASDYHHWARTYDDIVVKEKPKGEYLVPKVKFNMIKGNLSTTGQ